MATIDERANQLHATLLSRLENTEEVFDDIRTALQEVATDQRAACGNAVVESYGRTKGAKVLGEVAYQAVINAELK